MKEITPMYKPLPPRLTIKPSLISGLGYDIYDLYDVCEDIYTSVMIISQRTKQIIDQRVIPIEETEEVEDSIQFSEPEIVIEDIDKPMVVALE